MISFVPMKIHREGYTTLIIVAISLLLVNTGLFLIVGLRSWEMGSLSLLSILILAYFTQFFRSPLRIIDKNSKVLYAPADGKIVAIEETMENEYFKDKRLQVSIFMSPYNVHSNSSPLSGELTYLKYHPGKFLVAWHPKSSELNERSTLVIRSDSGTEIMVRQIAGAVARRIVTYPAVGDRLEQGEEIGFIKFGSRVDIFLPPGTKINASIGDTVRSGITKLSTDFN
jgi:phosphatidylserine decarboxylase